MTSPESSHTKNVANELSFPLVTHMTHFGIRFGRYGNLNLCFSSGHAMDSLKYRCSVRFLGRKMGETSLYGSNDPHRQSVAVIFRY
jgi:hypothetical protein